MTIVILNLGTVLYASGDEYEFMQFDLTLRSDGTMEYEENTKANFESDFSTSFVEIEKKGFSSLKDFSVSVNGQAYEQLESPDIDTTSGYFYANNLGDPYAALENNPELKNQHTVQTIPKEYFSGNSYMEWYIDREQSQFDFNIQYTAQDAVIGHGDTTEFYWMPLSGKSSFPVRKAKINVHIPEGATQEQIKAWAHGPLSGEITIVSPTLVTLEVDNLFEGDFVDVRLALPNELFPNLQRSDIEMLPSILAEEQANADVANAKRAKAKTEVMIALIAPFVMLGASLFARKRIRDKNKPFVPEAAPEYYRDLPANYSPAVTYTLCSFYKKGRKLCEPKENKITSILLDLAVRKVIALEVEEKEGLFKKEDTILTLINNGEDLLKTEYEKDLIDLLFGKISKDHKTVTMNEIKTYGNKKPQKLMETFAGIEGLIEQDAKKQDIMEAKKETSGKELGLLFGIPIVLGFLFSLLGYVILGISLIIDTMLIPTLCIASVEAKHLTQKGENQHALWFAFRKFLEDFSLMDEKELPELAIWEQYLVYATALGVADTVIKQLPLKYPQLNEPEARYHCGFLYYSTRHQHSTFQSIHLFSETLSKAQSTASIAISSSSSGSGGGGGFSSGGGGGGGGGSHGAR